MAQEITQINLGGNSSNKVVVHPLVPLSILQFFYRNDNRVIGTLLGTVHANVIYVTNCYAVPYQVYESDDYRDEVIIIDEAYNQTMYESNQKIYPHEIILGGFVTIDKEKSFDLPIISDVYQNFFVSQQFLSSPLVLSIFTDITSQTRPYQIQAFIEDKNFDICKEISQLYALKEVPVTVEFSQEKLNTVTPFLFGDQKDESDDYTKKLNFELIDLENFNKLVKDMKFNLITIREHVNKIIKQEALPDQSFGKAIKNLFNIAPHYSPKEFGNLLDKYTEDAVLIQFLSNIARTHSVISERLSVIVPK